jgi:two-component system OmpR family response regulator
MTAKKPKILLIDDEEGFTKLTQLTLDQYEIRVENDSRQALQTAREFKPDLILLDIMMPNLDGGDVAAQLRNDRAFKTVPIVFLTALVTNKENAQKPVMGGYPFIAKPITAKRLAENISKHLSGA